MPKIVDRGARRLGFVAASWAVIAQEGLNAATLRRVAAEAGATTGALTHYFDDRDALLVEALRTAHLAAGKRMLSAAQRSTDDRSRLLAVLEEALPLDARRLQEWRVWLAFWGAAVGAPTLTTENEARYEEWRGLLHALLARLIEDAGAVGDACGLLIALIDGLGARLALAGPKALAAERARARRLLASQVDGLIRPRDAATAKSQDLAR